MTSPVCPQLQTNCCATANVEKGQKTTSPAPFRRSGSRSQVEAFLAFRQRNYYENLTPTARNRHTK